MPGTAREIWRWTRSRQLDLVHLHGRAAGVSGRVTPWISRVPIVFTPHGVHPSATRLTDFLDRLVQKLLQRRTAAYVMVGEAERAKWQARYGFAETPVWLLPNTIDPEQVQPTAGPREPDVSSSEVLIPGAYHRVKRFADVLRAASRCTSPPRMVFVGSTAGGTKAHRRELAKLSRQLGIGERVVLTGEVVDLPALMMDAGLVVLSSESEGRPFTALEAAAVGAMVAWSDIPAHREIFQDSGAAFAVGDIGQLVNLLDEPHRWPELRINRSRAVFGHRWAQATRASTVRRLVALAQEQPCDPSGDDADGSRRHRSILGPGQQALRRLRAKPRQQSRPVRRK